MLTDFAWRCPNGHVFATAMPDVPSNLAAPDGATVRLMLRGPHHDRGGPGARVRIEFDDSVEGPGDAFQTIVDDMAGLIVEVTPVDGGPAFHAVLLGGHEDADSDLDEV